MNDWPVVVVKVEVEIKVVVEVTVLVTVAVLPVAVDDVTVVDVVVEVDCALYVKVPEAVAGTWLEVPYEAVTVKVPLVHAMPPQL
ncbi:MAG: hypothetical protein LYZ69_05075 [Nitrososphaerales archaeon]|nr:hypothetical protein [Nitrososphaerales archaeon]